MIVIRNRMKASLHAHKNFFLFLFPRIVSPVKYIHLISEARFDFFYIIGWVLESFAGGGGGGGGFKGYVGR